MTDEQYKLELAGALQFAGSAKTKKYRARFVKAGAVLGGNRKPSGITITPEALMSAAPSGLFENKAVFLDHAGFFDYPSLTRLAGSTMNTSYNATEQSIEGEIRLFETPTGDLAEQIISELLGNSGNSPDIGLSIVFYPKWDKEHETIIGINHVESVDLVFQPAADGRILQALSAFAGNGYNPASRVQDQRHRLG